MAKTELLEKYMQAMQAVIENHISLAVIMACTVILLDLAACLLPGPIMHASIVDKFGCQSVICRIILFIRNTTKTALEKYMQIEIEKQI